MYQVYKDFRTGLLVHVLHGPYFIPRTGPEFWHIPKNFLEAKFVLLRLLNIISIPQICYLGIIFAFYLFILISISSFILYLFKVYLSKIICLCLIYIWR